MTESSSPFDIAHQAAHTLREASGVDVHTAAVVLGSGWSDAADAIGETIAEFALADLPGFLPPTVAGHGGMVRSVQAGDQRILVFLGRTHLYEGRGVNAVVHGVRTAAAAGVRAVVLTNGAGAVDPNLPVGAPVLISDHLNLTARSPLTGATFVDLTDLYTTRLRTLAQAIDPSLAEGVYAQLPGPHYETPAEIRYLRTIGADLVGMSTGLEAIAAREAGLDVLGVSLVTNAAAGVLHQPLDHAEVLAAGAASAPRLGGLLAEVVRHL